MKIKNLIGYSVAATSALIAIAVHSGIKTNNNPGDSQNIIYDLNENVDNQNLYVLSRNIYLPEKNIKNAQDMVKMLYVYHLNTLLIILRKMML